MTTNLVGGVVKDRRIVVNVDNFDAHNHRPRLRRVTTVTGYYDYLVAKITTQSYSNAAPQIQLFDFGPL